MFIKSQNRTLIVDTDFVYISDDDNTDVVAAKDGFKVELGKYKTNDRAKEVLEEICDALEDGMEIVESYDIVGQLISRNCIFEMPKC